MWSSRESRRRDTFNRPSARSMILLGGMTYTRFGSRGRFFKSCVVASSPPADAPMPTTGNVLGEQAAASVVVGAMAGFTLRRNENGFTRPRRLVLIRGF